MIGDPETLGALLGYCPRSHQAANGRTTSSSPEAGSWHYDSTNGEFHFGGDRVRGRIYPLFRFADDDKAIVDALLKGGRSTTPGRPL